MNDETTQITKPLPELKIKGDRRESKIFDVSVRAWLALMITGTLCYCTISLVEIKEPFYSISVAAIAFYFGQNLAKTPLTP